MNVTLTEPVDVEKAAQSSGLELFELMADHHYEQIVLCHEPYTGLRAVITIHDTTLGPSLGGIRMFPYANERDAIVDGMRLARAMTFKAAVAGLNLGGGKTVVIGDPRRDKTEALFRALGRFVDTLNGRYIAAEDVGTATADMDYVAMETPFVTGIEMSRGGSGDPSPMTALGAYQGIRATAQQIFGSPELKGLRISVQGCGNVGSHLVRLLSEAGAVLTITDTHAPTLDRIAAETGATVVTPDAIFDTPCDIFAPCAMGGVINEANLARLEGVRAIAGAANNQLAHDGMGQILKEHGILYAPDYVINAGGLINVSEELGGYNPERARKLVKRIYENLTRVYDAAVEQDIPPHEAAQAVALKRIADIRPIADVWTGGFRTAWQHRPSALQH